MKVATVSKLPREEARREAPHNVEIEQALLGAVLINEEALDRVSGFLEADHFFEPIHAEIYRLFKMMRAGQRKITPTTLRPFLPAGDVAGMKISTYIARLAAEATTIINAVDYAEGIVEFARRRKLLAIAEDMAEAAQRAGPDFTALRQIEFVEDQIGELREELGEKVEVSATIQDGYERLLVKARDVAAGNQEDIPSTGFEDMDKALGGGYRPGRLIVLAGRPGMGKSIVAAASARRVARRRDGRFGALINSLEIDLEEMTARILADELAQTNAPIPYRDILHGQMEPESFAHLERARDRIAELPIKIDATSGITIHEIEARARLQRDRMAAQGRKLGVLFIDYLGLVRPTDRYRGRRVDEVGEIAFGAKNMAKRLGLCVVLLSQLNRSVESRDDKRPTMADLRDSGEVEAHADAVGLLYRPIYYLQRQKQTDADSINEMADKKNVLEINLDKNRLGPSATIKLFCNVAYSQVDNMRAY